nr:MAG: wsv151-like protein [Chiromantes dehaani nimavirus]
MSCFTIRNINNSLESCLREIKLEEENIQSKTKLVSDKVKALLAERKTMSPTSSSSAVALDSALCNDAIGEYEVLRTDTEKTIRKTHTVLSQLVKCTRKQKAVALLDKKLDSSKLILPPECVFVSKFVPRYRNRIHREQFEYVASCVRVGGEYAVAMRRRNNNNNNKERFIFDKEAADKVFPLKSRDEFVIDGSYPLVGFEDDAYGNTHAVFLTGLALGVKLPEKVPAAEPNNGLHDILIKGYRVAKVPALCLFDTPDSIAAMEFIKDEENSVFVPATQPMDEEEHAFLSEALQTEFENQTTADEAPEVEQKVYVYDSGPRKNPIFFLTVDEIGNSWCNMNSTRCVKSGGFSGEKDGVEMNDISCFSDCVDISVNMWEAFNCCVMIESGRRLFEASPAPFTRSDAIKYKIDSAPITSSFTDDDDAASSSSYGEIRLSTNNEKNNEVKRSMTARGFCKFKMNSSPQEINVLEKLVEWSEKTKFDNMREVEEENYKNSWWCSYSPPLKIEEEEEEPEAERCVETEAAVKTAYMIDRLTLEQEVVPFLQNVIYSSLREGKGDKPLTQMKLERSLQELKENVERHNNIWSTQCIKTARALLMDEAYAASVAHQITHRITNSGVFEGMCISDTRKDGVYQGQRKYVSGSKMVNVSAMKQDGEREIDAALKEWIKSKLSQVPSFLTSYSASIMRKGKKRGAPSLAPGEQEEPPRKKFIKGDENGSPESCSSSKTSEDNHQSKDFVRIIPPSFMRMPKINMEHLAEDLADSFGRALCGMKNAADVYQNMCFAVAELRERLLTGPFRRFNICPELECRLFDTVKAEDVERDVETASVLDYESKRLEKLLLEASIYQRFNETFKKSCSWSMGIKNDSYDTATKNVIIATTLRNVYEEYHAFKMLVNVFIFDKLRKELEGNAPCKNTSLAAAFNWYCMVVARNRICDVFRHIVKPNHDKEPYRHFYENLINNTIIVSVITNKIIDSLRWIMNTEIPSGYLKGLLDIAPVAAETEEIRKSSGKKTPCETIDETAKFVVPSLKIIGGSATNVKSVRIASHIVGPIYIRVNFAEIGLDRVKYGKLFVNTVTGNGLLTVSPNYDDIREGEEKNSVFSDVAHDLVSHKTKILLPTFLAAPSGGVSKGGNALFDVRTFQSINTTTTTTNAVATPVQKPWSYEKAEQSNNMWRCGFVIPKKLCDIIFNNRRSVEIIASPSKKSKTTSTMADSCVCQNNKVMEKVCKALVTFTKGSSEVLAKNLASSSLTKIDVKICRCEDSSPIATCLMVHEECKKQFHSGVDNYFYAFFNFKYKSLRFTGEEKSVEKEKTKKVDSLYITGALQSLKGIVNHLHALKNKHESNISSFRKKRK